MYVCVYVCSRSRAIRVLSCLGPEHLEPSGYRPLTCHGAVPGLPESCCVALGQPITPAAKRERLVGEAIGEVAIAHDQGHGDNRRSSLGPLYRRNVDYEA